ncbi:hypothetical protein [Parafilimonas sp.]|uniref:hypothetical protein n=1 Tax=Parafilimonas sp. TaxID=1969739 RepID=UPI0039E306BD
MYHWNFETVDIAPYLKTGSNIIAALVWNFGDVKAAWQASLQTGFILQGDTKTEQIVNTGKSWKCIEDTAYSPLQPQLIYVYYAAGAAEKTDIDIYPHRLAIPHRFAWNEHIANLAAHQLFSHHYDRGLRCAVCQGLMASVFFPCKSLPG